MQVGTSVVVTVVANFRSLWYKLAKTMNIGGPSLGSGLECKLDQLPQGLAWTESVEDSTVTVIGLLIMYCCERETVGIGEEVLLQWRRSWSPVRHGESWRKVV